MLLCTYSYAGSTHRDIADSVLRLHIIAQSDNKHDQETKLFVRDYILNNYKNDFNITDSDCAYNTAAENITAIERLANEALKKANAPYTAKAYTGSFYFPTKTYSNISLPAGYYKAVRIVLGDGFGQNWWCVMYPPLCFTESAAGNLSDEEIETLKSSMSRSDYEIITQTGKLPIEIKFRIVEIFGRIFK